MRIAKTCATATANCKSSDVITGAAADVVRCNTPHRFDADAREVGAEATRSAVAESVAPKSIDARIIMQVHDELVLEVKAGQLEATGEHVRGLMVDAADLKVPLEVDVGIGDSWEEAH